MKAVPSPAAAGRAAGGSCPPRTSRDRPDSLPGGGPVTLTRTSRRIGDCGTMAQDQDRTTAGGNKPKPANGPGSAGQSAKDRSKAQSRSISTKSPAGKGGKPGAKPGPGGKGGAGGKGGNTPRSGARPAPAAPKRRASGGGIPSRA